jgi:hypothetical protein
MKYQRLRVGKAGLPPLLNLLIPTKKSGGKPTFLTLRLSDLNNSHRASRDMSSGLLCYNQLQNLRAEEN